jgi:hypothetical protein
MKKYAIPIIALFVDISLHAFKPELIGIRLFFQGIVYFSLLRVLVFKTSEIGKTTNILLKWTIGTGLLVPVLLIKAGIDIIDQIYIADLIILVPILYHELIRKDD